MRPRISVVENALFSEIRKLMDEAMLLSHTVAAEGKKHGSQSQFGRLARRGGIPAAELARRLDDAMRDMYGLGFTPITSVHRGKRIDSTTEGRVDRMLFGEEELDDVLGDYVVSE